MPSPTTSSPVASLPRERALAGLVLADYAPEESEEAMELERAAEQGVSYRLAFRREAFHRRAEGFAVHRIRTARAGGRLVGIAAAALKDVELHGRRLRAAFFFDLRVRPEVRGLRGRDTGSPGTSSPGPGR